MFVGRVTLVADAYPMKSGKQFVNTLEDNIRRRGAIDKLLSDSAKTEISNKVMDILRAYHISNWHSEPYHQNQNHAESRYRTIKSWTNHQRVQNINFILDIGNGKVEELISYNQLLEHLENAQDHDMGMDQELYRFRAIIGHQGPLLASDPDWIGSKYNAQVEWETGEIIFEPLSIIAADDPVTCAAYAKENDLPGLEGWHRFRSLAKKDKVLARAIKQCKIRQVRRSQTYMFGYLIPRNYMEAMQFDSENKNSKWYDAIKIEMESMLEHKVLKKWDEAILDKHKKVMNPPKGYHRI